MTDLQCQSCAGKVQDAWICRTCSTDLRETLASLADRVLTNPKTGETRPGPGWLELLEDSMLGGTRLGESARRSSDLGSPMPCSVGKSGDWTGSPSSLHADISGLLFDWVQNVCERQNITYPTGGTP